MSSASEWLKAWGTRAQRAKPLPDVEFKSRAGAQYARITVLGSKRLTVGLVLWHGVLNKRDALRLARWIIDTFGDPEPTR